MMRLEPIQLLQEPSYFLIDFLANGGWLLLQSRLESTINGWIAKQEEEKSGFFLDSFENFIN